MPCGYCGVGGHDINHCPDRLEEYHGVPSDNSADHDTTVWVEHEDVWHASMFRDAGTHSCACGAQLEAPTGRVDPDDSRVAQLDRCTGCLDYLDGETDSIPDGGEFETADRLRADGGVR